MFPLPAPPLPSLPNRPPPLWPPPRSPHSSLYHLPFLRVAMITDMKPRCLLLFSFFQMVCVTSLFWSGRTGIGMCTFVLHKHTVPGPILVWTAWTHYTNGFAQCADCDCRTESDVWKVGLVIALKRESCATLLSFELYSLVHDVRTVLHDLVTISSRPTI